MNDTWDAFESWHYVIPPSRPSARELGIVADALARLPRDLPVAVLGSTPEFRDLLFELSFATVFVFERNTGFHARMNNLRVYNHKDTLVVGDWLDTLPRYRRTFCAILSDLTSGNVPYKLRGRYYRTIANALRPDGIFYDKQLTHSGPFIPLADLMSKYSTLPLNLIHINGFSCEVLFCSALLADEVVDTSRFYEFLESRWTHPRLAAFVQAAQRVTPRGGRWYYGRPWNALSSTYLEHFEQELVADDAPGSPYFGRLKLFVHRLRPSC